MIANLCFPVKGEGVHLKGKHGMNYMYSNNYTYLALFGNGVNEEICPDVVHIGNKDC